jgi:hypothetical protein
MKLLSLSLLTMLVSLATADDPADDAVLLVRMDLREVDLYSEWVAELDIFHADVDYFMAFGSEELAAERREVEILDTGNGDAVRPADYVLVHVSDPVAIAGASRLGTILMEEEDILLVRLSGPVPEPFFADGVRFVQPLRPRSYSWTGTPRDYRDEGYDDYVADIVTAVSEFSFQGFIQDLEGYQTRYASTDNYDTSAEYCLTTIESYGIDGFLQDFYASSFPCVNVVAEKPGVEDSTKIYVICGHLDSTSPQPYTLAPGADDNASGASAVLEAARVMSDWEFKYTIRFICFGAEEQGLYGSAYYASEAAAAGDDILGVVNLDMVLYAPSGQEVMWVPYDAQSTGLALALEAISDTYVPALEVEVEYSPGSTYSDHSSFWNNGYAAVLGIEEAVWSNPYYHQTTDLLINYIPYFPFGTNCVKGAIATVAYLAEPLGQTGIEEPEGEGGPGPLEVASLYPNPAAETVNLRMTLPETAMDLSISLFDISGRKWLSDGLNGSGSLVHSISVAQVPPGMYFVVVEATGQSHVSKLVIAR